MQRISKRRQVGDGWLWVRTRAGGWWVGAGWWTDSERTVVGTRPDITSTITPPTTQELSQILLWLRPDQTRDQLLYEDNKTILWRAASGGVFV